MCLYDSLRPIQTPPTALPGPLRGECWKCGNVSQPLGVKRLRHSVGMSSEGKDEDAVPPRGRASGHAPRPPAEKFKMPQLARPGATPLSVACYAGDAGRVKDLLGANNGAFQLMTWSAGGVSRFVFFVFCPPCLSFL